MIRRQFNLGIVGIALIVMCVLALVFAAGAIALRAQRQAMKLVRVPNDYPTIQAAIDASAPGDLIQVAPGTYTENLTLNKPVSLVAQNFDQINPLNNATIIDGRGGAAAIVVPPGLTQMPTVRGFAIRNSSNGIQAQSPLIVEYNYLYASAILVNYALGGGGVNHSNVYFQSTDDAIHLDNPDRPLRIENNRILYAGDDGIEIALQNTPALPGLTEIDIWNNMIIGSREDAIQFVDYPGDPQDTNRRFVLVGNLMANSKRAGIGLMPNGNTLEDYSGADTVESIRVLNNTFYGNDVGISGGDNLVAFNNIITTSVQRGVWRVQGGSGANSVVAYSLFYGNTVDADQTTLGAGLITGQDPLFAAAPNPGPDGIWETVDDDFSGLLLSPASPAIDKGITQYVATSGEPVPPNPITGFTGSAPDLGWREFGSPAFITPTATLAATITLAPTSTAFVLSPFPSLTAVVVTATPGPATLTPVPSSTPVPPTPVPPSATLAASATPTAAVTVTATPGLSILSIVPDSAQAGTTVNVTITGLGFANAATVRFEGGQGVAPEVTGLQVVNAQTIVMTVNVKADADFGEQSWDVRVTNPDDTTAVLTDAFTVVPAP
jgi:hypothetical protein